ncbi:MAG: stage II sporulation protein M [Gemmatimonadales bacterium]
MSPAPAETLDQRVDVETPEQVVLSYTIAGIASRGAAALIDYAVLSVMMLLLVLALVPFASRLRSMAWPLAIFTVVAFCIYWGYYVLFEGLWDGQTPGKRQLGLRVVRDGGYSITFGASAVRNLVRFIDMQPGVVFGAYSIGILSAVLSRSGKRLGDYAAGTIVVRERAVTISSGDSPPVSAGIASEPAGALAAALTDDEYALLDRYMARRNSLDVNRRAQFAEQLAVRFRDRLPGVSGSDSAVLATLYEHERAARARGAAGRSGTGAAREQNAIVAAGAARWRDFATMLTIAQHRGLGSMSEAEVSAFVARYRELAGDLARLQTASKGREIDSVFYLSRLVAGGHNLLYRDRRLTATAAREYLTILVPRELRRSALPIGIAALLLFGPTAISWVAVVRDPDVAKQFLPQSMLDRASGGVERARKHEGYIADFGELRPLAATGIMTNNINVTYLAFAGGILGGLGTVAALVFNGIQFGGVLGLYQHYGILPLIFAFVAPHGVLELSAIAIAGGGGLLIASALLLPGAMTRREALVIRGRRAIRLIAASTLILVVAGTLEGFVSPIPWWSLNQKLLVSGLTALALALYVNLDRGRAITNPGRQPETA